MPLPVGFGWAIRPLECCSPSRTYFYAMKCALLLALVSAALASDPHIHPQPMFPHNTSLAAALILRSDVTPVQKVVQMLENMKDKGVKDMEAEQVQFTEFKQFCEMTLAEKKKSISDASDKMETLEADIESAAADSERLAAEIAGHVADIETASAEKANATSIREKERADFLVALKDSARVW